MTPTLLAIVWTFGRLLLTGVVVVKVTRFRDTMNIVERTGLGLVGGTSFLTIPAIWEPRETPFEGWPATILTYGVLMFIAGRTWRDHQHEINGFRSNRQARRHLRSRGKL